MAETSKIQWTDATWNIARGCTKVDEDCKYCYMYRESLNGTRYEPKHVVRTKTVFNLPLTINEPSKIFASSLTDWGHKDIDPFRHEMFSIIRKCPHHTFQCLTKRTERLPDILPPDWGDGYDNVWLGTSVGYKDGTHRIDELCKVPAKIKFLSCEPLHGHLDLDPWLSPCGYYCDHSDESYRNWANSGLPETEDVVNHAMFSSFYHHPDKSKLDWVIVGGESGNENGKYRYRECKLEWIESIIDQCKRAGVPVFVKQLGTHLAKKLKLSDRHGGDINEWPEHLRIREFPNTKIVKGDVKDTDH